MKTLNEKTLYLLDMDGTVYLGDSVIDGAVGFINTLKRRGCEYVFLTNNSSKSADAYVKKLLRLGFDADKSNMFTSGQASAMMLAEMKKGASVYCVGTRSLKDELERYGLNVCSDARLGADFVLVGYDTELTYGKLEDACGLLCDGVPFYATNPDIVCPAENGRYLPDCHTMCDMLTAATGKTPYYIGKPRADFALQALKLKNKTADDAVIVGDRIYTDIKCGENANIFSVMVLSGESTVQDIDKYGIHPGLTVDSVRDIERLICQA